MAESQGTQIATEQTKGPQPQVKKEYKPLKWIRRHHRILVFAGAVIIFATFIVKDAIRERLRDLSESIKEAQADYIGTLNTSQAFFAYARIEHKVDELTSKSNQQDKRRSHYSQEELLLTQEHLAMAGSILRNVHDLYKKLPSDSDTDKLIRDVEAKFGPVSDAYDEAVKSPDILIPNPPSYGGVELASTAAERASAGLLNAVSGLSGHVLTKAQAVREKAEEEFGIYTWAAYFLYAFGWGLGLIGKLVGLELGGE